MALAKLKLNQRIRNFNATRSSNVPLRKWILVRIGGAKSKESYIITPKDQDGIKKIMNLLRAKKSVIMGDLYNLLKDDRGRIERYFVKYLVMYLRMMGKIKIYSKDGYRVIRYVKPRVKR